MQATKFNSNSKNITKTSVRILRAEIIRRYREIEAATMIQRSFRGLLDIFFYVEFDMLYQTLEETILEAELKG
jgi:hypothetical protein